MTVGHKGFRIMSIKWEIKVLGVNVEEKAMAFSEEGREEELGKPAGLKSGCVVSRTEKLLQKETRTGKGGHLETLRHGVYRRVVGTSPLRGRDGWPWERERLVGAAQRETPPPFAEC